MRIVGGCCGVMGRCSGVAVVTPVIGVADDLIDPGWSTSPRRGLEASRRRVPPRRARFAAHVHDYVENFWGLLIYHFSKERELFAANNKNSKI